MPGDRHRLRAAPLDTEWFRRFASVLGLDNPDLPDDQRNVQRKVWEFCAISAALEQRGMLE
jgi:hypothetical protein